MSTYTILNYIWMAGIGLALLCWAYFVVEARTRPARLKFAHVYLPLDNPEHLARALPEAVQLSELSDLPEAERFRRIADEYLNTGSKDTLVLLCALQMQARRTSHRVPTK
jgi:hypothetical protein